MAEVPDRDHIAPRPNCPTSDRRVGTTVQLGVKPCANPGCDQPGTKSCACCKTTPYCGPICQTADWVHHKEECDGHLLKMGKAHLAKADGFYRAQNWAQTLRYGELAATKLKQLKDRRLETVKLINNALIIQFDALSRMNRHREAMGCAEENYTLWAMNHMRNPGSMDAALSLIQSCLFNDEYEDALRYAREAYFMIVEMTDNFIPGDQQPRFLAEISSYLAKAILSLTWAGGIPPQEKQKSGEEAIKHARKALELHTQLHQSVNAASDMMALADMLDYFNDVDDDEIPRLHEQAIVILRRVEGSMSMNVAVGEKNLGDAYRNRARRADAAKDLDREVANAELALPHYREAARIFQAINHVDSADKALRRVTEIETVLRHI